MIVLDASVVIAHLVEGDAHSDAAFDILDTEEELVIHPITMAESLVGPVRVNRDDEALRLIAGLGIDELPWSTDEPITLARLRATTGLKLPDCCVLAAAVRENATLATFDARLAASARDAGVEVVGPSSRTRNPVGCQRD